MNCEEFRAATLAGDVNEHTSAHLQACAACRSRTEELTELRAALSEQTLWEEPSPELGLQVESLIGAAVGRSSRSDRIAGGRGWWIAAAAAAVLVVAIAGSLLATRGAPPDWEVALPATNLAPTAVATVQGWNEAAGTRMLLEVEGLDPAPAGYVYELWLSDGPVHISAGTFHSGGRVELWSGVTRADFPRLWVTLEPLDDDGSPSDATVLDTGSGSG
jgi:hypothetical protein